MDGNVLLLLSLDMGGLIKLISRLEGGDEKDD